MAVKRKAKAILLPTDELTRIVLHSTGLDPYYDCKEAALNSVINIGGMCQHLYITTEDEIKEGDWYYWDSIHNLDKSIYRYNKETLIKDFNQKNRYKIIATTDKSLTRNKTILKEISSVKMRGDYLECLPQPSQAFIEKYCKLGGINKVMVEYEKKQQFESENDYTYGCGIEVKVDSHNTITITSIKNSWSKEELSKLFKTQEGYNFIQFIYNRLECMHNENPNYDYMHKFKSIAEFVEDNL